MTFSVHRFHTDGIDACKQRLSERIRHAGDLVAAGKGNAPFCLEQIRDARMEVAGIGLITAAPDNEVRLGLLGAAAAAEAFLTAPPPAQVIEPRFHEVEADLDGRGRARAFRAREMPVPAKGEWSDGWDVSTFGAVLNTLIAFGSPSAARDAATAPESRYRNPHIVVEEAYYALVRGHKAWLLGEDRQARVEYDAARRAATQKIIRASALAMRALLDRDEEAFRQTLVDIVKEHKRVFSRMPAMYSAAFSLPGLALSRVARSYGFVMADSAYLPVRFLPPERLRDDSR